MEGVPRSSGALHTMSSWSADPSARGRRARERVKVLSFITQVHIGDVDAAAFSDRSATGLGAA